MNLLSAIGAGVPNSQRVAVGSGLRDRRAAEIAARAGAVVDDELLAELFAQHLRDGARQRVDRRRRPGTARSW